jgi:hypothetical protein
VAGGIRAGDQAQVTACDATTEGTQRYNKITHKMEYCGYSAGPPVTYAWTQMIGFNSCTIVTATYPAQATCALGYTPTGGGCRCASPFYVTSGGYPTPTGYKCNNHCTMGGWDWAQPTYALAVCCR